MTRQPHGYRFEDFEVTPGAAELRHSGTVVHVEPKVLKVLVHLIEHRDRLVDKSELLDAAWAESFVTENALTKAIGRLRLTLGDSAQSPRFIQTVHTRGYRFIAEVEETDAEEASVAEANARDTGPSARMSRRNLVGAILATAAIVVTLALTAASLRQRLLGGRTPPKIRSLAVLPLDNLTGTPDQDYLVDSIHEALIGELAQLSPLRVISRLSTLRYRDTDKTMPEIAEELAVDALVEGSVTRSANHIRVSAQLILGSQDEHLWAATFDRPAGDLLSLLSDLAGAIGEEIHIAIAPETKAKLKNRRLVSPEAEDAYFRARYFLSLGTRAGFSRSRALFSEVIELDPGFAEAHSGLSTTHFLEGLLGPVPHQLAAGRSERAALRALKLAPELAEAHAMLGLVRLYFDWDWPEAGRELKRALELSPNNGWLRHGYGDYLLVMGRLEESLEQVKIGRQYDPVSPIVVAPVVGHLLFLRRYDEVIEEARAWLEIDPNFPLVRGFLVSALWEQGRYNDSLQVLRERWIPRRPELVDALEQGYQRSGPRGAMLAVARQLATQTAAGPGSPATANPVTVARYFARGEDLDQAFKYLGMAVDNRQPGALHITVDPAFEILQPDPRFAALLRRMGLPEFDAFLDDDELDAAEAAGGASDH
jgi:TolB-like protein/DNA-binding winged helix-turn-helix (wHTH) protein